MLSQVKMSFRDVYYLKKTGDKRKHESTSSHDHYNRLYRNHSRDTTNERRHRYSPYNRHTSKTAVDPREEITNTNKT